MTILPTRATPITLTQSDPTGILRREIHMRLPSGATHVVFDGTELRFPFTALSLETEVTPGLEYQYTLRHSGGWPFSFELVSIVVDIEGNESESVFAYSCPAVAPVAGESEGTSRRIGSDLTDEDGTPNGQITDHTAQAQAHVIQYFTGKPRIDALLASWGTQNQDLENAAWAMLTQRGISSAVGDQLDNLGEIVGEPRQGRTDTAYRAAIRVRVLVNRSSGTGPELITITRRMAGEGNEVHFREVPPAAFVLTLVEPLDALPTDIARMVRAAKAGGVGANVVYVPSATRRFRHGHTPTSAGLTSGAAPLTGYGTTTATDTGGFYAAVL